MDGYGQDRQAPAEGRARIMCPAGAFANRSNQEGGKAVERPDRVPPGGLNPHAYFGPEPLSFPEICQCSSKSGWSCLDQRSVSTYALCPSPSARRNNGINSQISCSTSARRRDSLLSSACSMVALSHPLIRTRCRSARKAQSISLSIFNPPDAPWRATLHDK